MNSLRRPLPLAFLLALSLACFSHAGPAFADDGEDDGDGRVWKVKPDVRVQIELVSGDIEIKAWDREEVRVRIDGDDADAVDIDARPGRVSVRTTGSRRGALDWLANGIDVDVELSVPKGSRIEATTTNGQIETEGVTGTLDLNSANGSIDVRGPAREARLETINASIDFEGRESRVDARTINGSIELEGVAGELFASTISGSIRVQGGLLERVEMKTLSGAIELDGAFSPGARANIKSFSGSVRLELPSDTSARFEIHSFSGGIRNELETTESRSGGSAGRNLEFSTADGDARVSVESFSGGVEIRKAD